MKIRDLLIILALFWLMGYLREFFFVHLNYILYEKYYGHSSFPPPTVMRMFTGFSYMALYYSKYIFTALSLFIFFWMNYFTVRRLSQEKKLRSYVVYSYILLLFLAAASMVWGYFVKGRLQDDEYTFSRWLMGIGQSPIICLILLASEKLYSKSIQQK